MPLFKLNSSLVFPDPKYATPDGLLAYGGDLSIERLILAYANGIFPWYSEYDPILWWSPDPRLVLFFDDFKISKSLRQTLRSKKLEVRYDTCFQKVIQYCASVPRPDQNGTWITPEMKKAYIRLHACGIAHSVETFYNHELVGGLYGVAIGGYFSGESMFHLKSDASKVALYYLVQKLKELDFDLVDAQTSTPHLKRMGALEIPRKDFLNIIAESTQKNITPRLWS